MIDGLPIKRYNQIPEVDVQNNDSDTQLTEAEEDYSDRELVTDESSCGEYEPSSNELHHTSVMQGPVGSSGTSHLNIYIYLFRTNVH